MAANSTLPIVISRVFRGSAGKTLSPKGTTLDDVMVRSFGAKDLPPFAAPGQQKACPEGPYTELVEAEVYFEGHDHGYGAAVGAYGWLAAPGLQGLDGVVVEAQPGAL
jgi:hypothetical protein